MCVYFQVLMLDFIYVRIQIVMCVNIGDNKYKNTSESEYCV